MKTFCSPILQLPTRKWNICQRWDITLWLKVSQGCFLTPMTAWFQHGSSIWWNQPITTQIREVELALRAGKLLRTTHNLLMPLIGSNWWCENNLFSESLSVAMKNLKIFRGFNDHRNKIDYSSRNSQVGNET